MPGKPERKSGMFYDTKSWNPFVGCKFGCIYCIPSFKAQLKRRKNDPVCKNMCFDYLPHELHDKRLNKIISPKIRPRRKRAVFVAADGDISFCSREYTKRIIGSIKKHNERCPDITYLFQSKDPSCFKPFLKEFPENVILQTTLETNRDEGYEKWSGAPKPSVRYKDFLALEYPRKVVTIEPIMDFDLDEFRDWIVSIKPEHVWLGFNSKPDAHILKEKDFASCEPPKNKVQQLVYALENADGKIPVIMHGERVRELKDGIEVRGKNLRGLKTRSLGRKGKARRKG